MIAFGNALGRKVVAEGIESAFQLDLLRASGCSHGQGSLLQAPATADEFCRLLSERADAHKDARRSMRA